MNSMLNYELERLKDAIEWNLHCLYNADTKKAKEFFREENERLMALFAEEMKNWAAVL